MGRELRHFCEAGPSRSEEREAAALEGRSSAKREQRDFDKWVGGFTEATLDGKGEAHRFLNWSEHLKAYFRREGITNSVIQARLAERTFRGKMARWWNAHTEHHPERVLSFARVLELIRTEMVPAADPSAACLQWAGLQYEGKADAFLKELDRLTDTYPLERSALISLATRPFPPEFAGQVQTADAAHGKRGLTYPQLREIIKNYLKTLGKKAKAGESKEAGESSETEQAEEKPTRHGRRRHRLNAHPGQSVNVKEKNAVPNTASGTSTTPQVGIQNPALPVPQNAYVPPQPSTVPHPTPTYGVPRRGIGTHPCYVCGALGHPWVQCPQKIPRRGCAVCGSLAHKTNVCAQRYHPELQAQWHPGPPPGMMPSMPHLNVYASDHANQTVPIVPLTSTVPPVMNAISTSDYLCSYRTPSKFLPSLHPKRAPRQFGQLLFHVTLDRCPATALFDTGASHSFVRKE